MTKLIFARVRSGTRDDPGIRPVARSFLPLVFVYAQVLILTTLVSPSLHAEIVDRELGENLHYFRAHVLPSDLPSSDAKRGAIILDLRYALAEDEAPTALDAWLKFRATARTPVLILVNPDTAPALRELLISHTTRPGVITIGRANSETTPDIVITTSGEDERRAYDALEKNASVESLITENGDKPRIDEASIMRARSESLATGIVTSPEETVTNPVEKKTPSTAAIDRALQRAIHLHRALIALKRL